MTRRTATAWAVLCVLFTYAAASRLGSEAAVRTPVTHTVTVDSARFSPADLTINAGDSVVWTNKDLLPHTATTVKAGFDSAVIQPGESWRYTARRKGDFAYVCSFHPMKAMLRVK